MDINTRFELTSAKTKHLLFKSKMRSYLSGSSEVAENILVDPNACALGKWLVEVGPKYNQYSEMAQLNEAHLKMHVKAKEIIDLKNANKLKEAENKMADIEEIGSLIMTLVERLEKRFS